MTLRRGRGEGSITQLADGRFQARVDLGWVNGHRRRKALYGRTRAEVRDKLRTAIDGVQLGAVLPDGRQTVQQYLAGWLAQVKTRLRPRTWATYQQAVDLHLVPGLGHVRLARLSPDLVERWFTTHQEAGATARTIRYARTVLGIALNRALKRRLVAQNAAAAVEVPRHVTRVMQPLNEAQARRLLSVANDHRLGALVTVAVAVGLRMGEALGLRWQDLDLRRDVLRVAQALERSGGDASARKRLRAERTRVRGLWKQAAQPEDRAAFAAQLQALRRELRLVGTRVQFVEPKSARSRRSITLPDVVAAALRRHRRRQLRERLKAGSAWQESGLVFTTPIGTALDARNVRREYKAMLKAAKLPVIRFHDLRHTAATLLLALGVDPRTIMETLGHSQISLTLNTYSHVLPTLQRAAAEKMDHLLTGIGKRSGTDASS